MNQQSIEATEIAEKLSCETNEDSSFIVLSYNKVNNENSDNDTNSHTEQEKSYENYVHTEERKVRSMLERITTPSDLFLDLLKFVDDENQFQVGEQPNPPTKLYSEKLISTINRVSERLKSEKEFNDISQRSKSLVGLSNDTNMVELSIFY